MREPLNTGEIRKFCAVYLHTLDPARAAESVGRDDGWALLRRRPVQEELGKMRGGFSVSREDAVRRMAELAFGRANDVLTLGLNRETADPDRLDLSAVSELKITDKGVEVKFLDRVRALEALCTLLDGGNGAAGADEFFRALEDAGGEESAG